MVYNLSTNQILYVCIWFEQTNAQKTNKAAAVKVLSIFRINKNLLQKISNNATAVSRSI